MPAAESRQDDSGNENPPIRARSKGYTCRGRRRHHGGTLRAFVPIDRRDAERRGRRMRRCGARVSAVREPRSDGPGLHRGAPYCRTSDRRIPVRQKDGIRSAHIVLRNGFLHRCPGCRLPDTVRGDPHVQGDRRGVGASGGVQGRRNGLRLQPSPDPHPVPQGAAVLRRHREIRRRNGIEEDPSELRERTASTARAPVSRSRPRWTSRPWPPYAPARTIRDARSPP